MHLFAALRRFLIARLDAKLQSRPLWLDPPPLKVECSWCRVVMRDGVEPVSHGICEDCVEKFERGDRAEGRAA